MALTTSALVGAQLAAATLWDRSCGDRALQQPRCFRTMDSGQDSAAV